MDKLHKIIIFIAGVGFMLMLFGMSAMDSEDMTIPVVMTISGLILYAIAGTLYEFFFETH